MTNPSDERESEDHPALEQLKKVSENVEVGWTKTVAAIRQATLEVVPDIDDTTRELLLENFWPVFTGLMERTTVFIPNIMDQVLARTEELTAEQRQAEADFYDEVIEPRIRRRRFWHSIIGKSYDPMADYDQMMAEFQAGYHD